MDFEAILEILDDLLCSKLGLPNTNEILVKFMTEAVKRNLVLKINANQYLEPYDCKIQETCWGCIANQPNQLAHMDPSGCMYKE
jgi:hypothetical protein